MFLKNFFGEALEIGNQADPGKELEERYGLPKSQQKLFEINGNTFLSLSSQSERLNRRNLINLPNEQIKKSKISRSFTEIPQELLSLGVDPEAYWNLHALGLDEETIKSTLFPYTFSSSSGKSIISSKFDEALLDKIDSHIDHYKLDSGNDTSLTDMEKDLVLRNVEMFIGSFVNHGQ